MKCSVWQTAVLILLLPTGSSQANSACPQEKVENKTVANMCTDFNISGVQNLYLDAFVPADSAVTCNCSLWATALVQINIDHLQLPDTNCTSELDIQSNQWQEAITFTCSGEITPLYLKYLDNESVHLKLRTERGQTNSTYCIGLSITAFSGSLSVQCYSPNSNTTTTSSTIISTTNSTTRSDVSYTTKNNIFSNNTTFRPSPNDFSANSACPKEKSKNSQVAHMCRDVDIRGVQDLYLDAFVPAGSAVTCNCSLWATSLVQINIDHLQLPDTHCTSELDLHNNQWQESITFTCSGEITPLYLRYLDNESVHVKLRTQRGQINSTYCIGFSITALSGSLSVQCYSPNSNTTSRASNSLSTITTTSSTIISTRTSTTRSDVSYSTISTSKSTTISNNSSVPPQNASASDHVSPSSVTPTTTLRIDSTTKYKIFSNNTTFRPSPKDFPVAAVVGGVVAAALVFAVVVVVVVICIRKKRTKGNVNTDNTGDYVNAYVDVGDVGVNPLNTDNIVNPHDTEASANNTYERLQHGGVPYVNTPSSANNTYERLQQGGIHYVNTPSSVNNTYERLQHDGVQYVNTPPSADEDHVYLGMQNLHT